MQGTTFLFFLMLFALEAHAKTLTGADQILDPAYIKLISGKRVGVIAHYASRNREGKHLVDILHGSSSVNLKTIFSPEHGFRGLGDSRIPDSMDPQTGLPIVSLYGPRKAPEPKHLKNLDVIVLDLQDVGVRFYTYATTMALAMRAAGEAGVEMVILDRPNPVGADLVEGAVLEDKWQGSFEAYYPVATRHGMTMGELARLYLKSFGVEVRLNVVPLKKYTRSMRWPETGLEWISPSPALPTYEQALLYSSFGAFETFPLAVGRSVDNKDAFKIFGAPWISRARAEGLVEKLNQLPIEEIEFSFVEWTPDRREYRGELCRGFRVALTGKELPGSLRNFVLVSQAIKRVLGRELVSNRTHRALGADWISFGIESLSPMPALLDLAQERSKLFLKRREAALIY